MGDTKFSVMLDLYRWIGWAHQILDIDIVAGLIFITIAFNDDSVSRNAKQFVQVSTQSQLSYVYVRRTYGLSTFVSIVNTQVWNDAHIEFSYTRSKQNRKSVE